MDLPCHRFTHNAMASVFEVHAATDDATYARQVAMTAFAEVDRIEGFLSRFIRSSDISQINHAAVGEWVPVNVHALACLKLAAAVHDETDGAFDVTIGPLMACWRADDFSLKDPTETELAAARAKVGMQHLEFDDAALAVRKTQAGLDIDLGAVGKGYVVDCVADLLHEWDLENVLVNAGDSTTLGVGRSDETGGWRVGVGGAEGEETPYATLLRGQVLSGSGTASRGHHIMSPRTGRPVFSCAGAWSLVARGEAGEDEPVYAAARADALSTAFFVMTPDEVEAYCTAHPDTSAMLLHRDGDRVERLCFGPWDLIDRLAEEQ